MSVITLTTDFGTHDWFVGTMKGVILGINPRARIVDLTHDIPAGDTRAGAFALAAGCNYFPEGTIHVAVVDPGVGGPRRPIAVRTKRFIFIGPDNGLLSLALTNQQVRTVRLLQNKRLFLPEISQTFHGRDMFAPVAAHLSRGVGFRKVGTRAGSYVQLDWPKASATRDRVDGQVVHIDRFGNAITNIPGDMLPSEGILAVLSGGKRLCRVESFYDAVPAGKPVAVVGSTGTLEIAINRGMASTQLGLQTGAAIRIKKVTFRKSLSRACCQRD